MQTLAALAITGSRAEVHAVRELLPWLLGTFAGAIGQHRQTLAAEHVAKAQLLSARAPSGAAAAAGQPALLADFHFAASLLLPHMQVGCLQSALPDGAAVSLKRGSQCTGSCCMKQSLKPSNCTPSSALPKQLNKPHCC